MQTLSPKSIMQQKATGEIIPLDPANKIGDASSVVNGATIGNASSNLVGNGSSITGISGTVTGILGEVRMLDLSLTGAVSKATMIANGWAVCDGTTPVAQGILDPIITTTRDYRSRFLRGSASETTGGTGGAATHNHKWTETDGVDNHKIQIVSSSNSHKTYNSAGTANQFVDDYYDNYTNMASSNPLYTDIVFFVKVK